MKKGIAILAAALFFLMINAALADGYIEANSAMNVRSGPGTDYNSIGVISEGAALSYENATYVDAYGTAWYKVYFNGRLGWVSSACASLCEDEEEKEEIRVYVEATGNVNVRKGAGTDCEVYNTLSAGERVLFLDETRYDDNGTAWYKVQYYSYTDGWVSSAHSRLVYGAKAGVKETEDAVFGSYVKISGGDCRMRSGPGLGYSTLNTLGRGETAQYLNSYSVDERGVTWYYVSYDDEDGWVSSRYAELS